MVDKRELLARVMEWRSMGGSAAEENLALRHTRK